MTKPLDNATLVGLIPVGRTVQFQIDLREYWEVENRNGELAIQKKKYDTLPAEAINMNFDSAEQLFLIS